MASFQTPQKAEHDLESGTTRTGSTHSHSEIEKENLQRTLSEPDVGHDEVEQMDEGHMDDLARTHVKTLNPPN
jgi:hypothetical protein